MKTPIYLILIVTILFVTSKNTRAENPFRLLTGQFSGEENLQFSELGKKTIRLYIKEKDPGTEVSDQLSHIDQLNILNFQGDNQFKTKRFIESLSKCYPIEEYTPINVSVEGEMGHMIYIRENEQTITDLLVAEVKGKKVSFVEIKGELDLEKIARLGESMNIGGLEPIDQLKSKRIGPGPVPEAEKAQPFKYRTPPINPPPLRAPSSGFRPWLLNSSDRTITYNTGKEIMVYDRYGNKIMDGNHNPALLINGYSATSGYNSIRNIPPACIESINLIKGFGNESSEGKGLLEISLKGMKNQLFTVCEGMLYFGQNGQLQSVEIGNHFAPKLLIDCQEKPLCEIENLNPEEVKSIELSQNPTNCVGKAMGQFIVVESKQK